MTRLHNYLSRLQATIESRQEVEVEALDILDRSDKPRATSRFYALLRFYDGSRLQVVEKLIVERFALVKPRYIYHYQSADGALIFRYDNAPHHREVKTYPHHKHIGEAVVEARPPDLSEVLREIDAILYHQ